VARLFVYGTIKPIADRRGGRPAERPMLFGRLRSTGGADSLAENGREDPPLGIVFGTLEGLAPTDVGSEAYLAGAREPISLAWLQAERAA